MILTKKFLINEAKTLPYQKRDLYESIKFSNTEVYDLFLSHSYLDKDIVNGLYKLFEECGYKVFIDWKNEELEDRESVSAETAMKLKKFMNVSKGLLYISTKNSSNSKWCPWELGFVDGLKNRVAILPILDHDASQFSGQEYLGIYPYITYTKYANKNQYQFWVHSPIDYYKYSTLADWIKNGKLDNHSKD